MPEPLLEIPRMEAVGKADSEVVSLEATEISYEEPAPKREIVQDLEVQDCIYIAPEVSMVPVA